MDKKRAEGKGIERQTVLIPGPRTDVRRLRYVGSLCRTANFILIKPPCFLREFTAAYPFGRRDRSTAFYKKGPPKRQKNLPLTKKAGGPLFAQMPTHFPEHSGLQEILTFL